MCFKNIDKYDLRKEKYGNGFYRMQWVFIVLRWKIDGKVICKNKYMSVKKKMIMIENKTKNMWMWWILKRLIIQYFGF